MENDLLNGHISNTTKKICEKYIKFHYWELKRKLDYPWHIKDFFSSHTAFLYKNNCFVDTSFFNDRFIYYGFWYWRIIV